MHVDATLEPGCCRTKVSRSFSKGEAAIGERDQVIRLAATGCSVLGMLGVLDGKTPTGQAPAADVQAG